MQHLHDASHVAHTHTIPRASQSILIWPFTRAVDLLCDRISLCKVPRATKLVEKMFKHVMSHTFCNLRSWRMDPKWCRQSPRPVFILKELNTAIEWSGFKTKQDGELRTQKELGCGLKQLRKELNNACIAVAWTCRSNLAMSYLLNIGLNVIDQAHAKALAAR